MTIVVLLILVVVWAAVLGPSLLRRRVDRRSGDSIGAFHRQLRVLERAGPTLVDPAFRLTTALPDGAPRAVLPAAPPRPGLILVRPDAPAMSPRTAAGAAAGRFPAAGSTDGVPAVAAGQDPYFRPGACKRRRDVVLCLVSAVLGSALLGAIPALRPMLLVTAFAGVAAGLYVGLLVRLRHRADERAAKLRYLPPPVVHEPTLVVRRSAAR